MTKIKKYYVYVHRYASGEKLGKVFYVGKGSGDRHALSYGRSQQWNRTSEKYGFTSEIISHFECEQDAFYFEVDLIKKYGRNNLCNHTDGGEGPSGYIMSDENKEILSRRWTGVLNPNFGKPLSDARKSMIRAKKIGVLDTRETRLKKSKARLGNKNPSYDIKTYRFKNSTGETFIGTQYNFRMTFNLRQQSVSRLCLGKRKTHNKWFIENV